MTYFLRRYVGILFLLVLLSACQNGGSTFTRFEDSPVIDHLLDSAHHFVVNTDIEPERWVATTITTLTLKLVANHRTRVK